jgi:hypothetical protein
VLLFVADTDPLVHPCLRGFFYAAPKNERLRALLHNEIIGLFVEANAVPQEELGLCDAGSGYHLAILSPSGLTPLVTFAVQKGDPEKIVDEVVLVLERLLDGWQ